MPARCPLPTLANRALATLFLGIDQTAGGTVATTAVRVRGRMRQKAIEMRQKNVKTRILDTVPYLRVMIKGPMLDRTIVKDCTRSRFCLKELPHRERLTAA